MNIRRLNNILKNCLSHIADVEMWFDDKICITNVDHDDLDYKVEIIDTMHSGYKIAVYIFDDLVLSSDNEHYVRNNKELQYDTDSLLNVFSVIIDIMPELYELFKPMGERNG